VLIVYFRPITRWLYCVECPQYSTRSTCVSVWLSKWACPKITSGQSNFKAYHCRRRVVQCYSTGDGNVSFHKGTLAPPGKYDWTFASFSWLKSTTEMANGSVQPFLHSLRQKVPILYNGRPYPQELPLPMGDLDLPCNTWCFRPMRVHSPNGTSIGSAIFAQMTAECLYTLQWFACFPLKIAPSQTSGPHVRGSLAPPESGMQIWQLDRFIRFCRAH